jgi:DNA-binding Lrp family transcriptional regulator
VLHEDDPVDETDRRLLDGLRRDGRASYEELARSTGLSRTAARARVSRMLDAGIVRVEAVVHPVVDGTRTIAHVSAVVGDGAVRDVADGLAALHDCPFVSIVAGRFSLIVEIRTTGLQRLEAHLERLRALPGVEELDTLLYTDIVKDPYHSLGRPEEFPSVHLDDVDRLLVDLLRRSPRASYAELASALGLSPGATRARVSRIVDGGIVSVTGLVTPAAVGAHALCGFALHLGDGSDAVAEVASLTGVDFLARTIGRCDAVGTILTDSAEGVRETVTALTSLAGVRRVETWWHLELVKERYGAPGEHD